MQRGTLHHHFPLHATFTGFNWNHCERSRQEGRIAECLASEMDPEHADALPKSAKREPTDPTAPEDRGADAFESKREGDVDVPIEPMDSGAPDISLTDESMDLVAKTLLNPRRGAPSMWLEEKTSATSRP